MAKAKPIPSKTAIAQPTMPRLENPQVDEAVWQKWLKKHERLDEIRRARRLKVVIVLAAVSAVGFLVQRFLSSAV